MYIQVANNMNWLQKISYDEFEIIPGEMEQVHVQDKSGFTPEDFQNLANAQIDAPENAMRNIQFSNIAPLYGWTTEHVGDLTHRMSEHIEGLVGQHEIIKDKVDKTLYYLTQGYGFLKEIKEQIKGNLGVSQGHDNTPEGAMITLKELGQKYANEHRKLPVINNVQTIARDAAIALGEFRLEDSIGSLNELLNVLNKGPEVWKQAAQERLHLGEQPNQEELRLV